LTYRESLRDIEACLSAQAAKLYHMGLGEPVRRATLADANESRDWHIHAEFAHRPDHRRDRRSNRRIGRSSHPPGLSSASAAHSLSQRRNGQDTDLSDQSGCVAGIDDLRPVQKPLAGGVVFKWIKQHLRIQRLYGTSENAVKSRIWIAVSVYVLVAVVRKRLNLEAPLYTLLQVFSVTVFEKIEIQTAFSREARQIGILTRRETN
jgi:hypothetical protein